VFNDEFETNVEKLETALKLAQAELQGQPNEPEGTTAVEKPMQAIPQMLDNLSLFSSKQSLLLSLNNFLFFFEQIFCQTF